MTLGALKLPESAHSALAVALRRVVDLKVLRSCRREMNIDCSNITLQQAEKSSVASLIAEAQLATTTEGSEPQSDGAAVALAEMLSHFAYCTSSDLLSGHRARELVVRWVATREDKALEEALEQLSAISSSSWLCGVVCALYREQVRVSHHSPLTTHL